MLLHLTSLRRRRRQLLLHRGFSTMVTALGFTPTTRLFRLSRPVFSMLAGRRIRRALGISGMKRLRLVRRLLTITNIRCCLGPRPGSGRTRHMLYKYPWAGGDRYHYTFVEVSTRYELSLPSPRFGIVQDVGTRPTFWVAIPYTPPDNLTWGTVLQNGLVWDFSKGQYHNFVHPHQQTGLPGASSPPGYPISAYTQSYLCFPLLYNSEGVSTYYFAFAKCTAGFTAHFTQGDLAAWQSGAAVWSIDEVTAFGYSDAVPIEGASGVLGEWCPAA